MIVDSDGNSYEDKLSYLMGKPSTDSTMPSGGNKKPAGEVKDDSGTQVASSNKPIAPTWRDLRPDTYVPTEGAPSQQPQPKPIPIKPEKQSMKDLDRRTPPPLPMMDSPTMVPDTSGIDTPPPPKMPPKKSGVEGVQVAMADDDVRKGRSIKPEHGAPGGPSGGSLTLNRHPEVSKDYFRIRDSEGKVVAGAHLSPTKDGKGVSVGAIFETINIAGRGDSLGTPNIIGTRAIRSLIPEVKRHFPDAEYIEGLRISGARPKATNAKVPIK